MQVLDYIGKKKKKLILTTKLDLEPNIYMKFSFQTCTFTFIVIVVIKSEFSNLESDYLVSIIPIIYLDS